MSGGIDGGNCGELGWIDVVDPDDIQEAIAFESVDNVLLETAERNSKPVGLEFSDQLDQLLSAQLVDVIDSVTHEDDVPHGRPISETVQDLLCQKARVGKI